MGKIIREMINRYGKIFCAFALLIAPITVQGCRCKFYQPEEPENLEKLLRIKVK